MPTCKPSASRTWQAVTIGSLNVTIAYVGKLLNLTRLASDITAAILDGHQPHGVSVNLMLKDVPVGWDPPLIAPHCTDCPAAGAARSKFLMAWMTRSQSAWPARSPRSASRSAFIAAKIAASVPCCFNIMFAAM